MTTSTKEQIEKVYDNLRKELRYVWEWAINETPGSENNRKEIMRIIIIEWEKIRNNHKQDNICEEQYASKNLY